MKTFALGSALALALTTTALNANPIAIPGGPATLDAPAQVWLAKGNDNGKGHGKVKHAGKGNDHAANGNNGKGHGKPAKAEKAPEKAKGKPDHAASAKADKADKGKPEKLAKAAGKANGHRAFSDSERAEITQRIVTMPAPAGRDMATILGATGLALATSQLVVADTPEDQLITYANCPPGLAKKDPPCVPPGLARDGVTFEQWASYTPEQYDEIWLDRRADVLRQDIEPDPSILLLQSDQIATLFDLAAAPEGHQYALIDGLPVLLDNEDYTSLLLVNQMAQVAELAGAVPVAPTAALTQSELVNLYRLPALEPDQNYAVVNGQVVRLSDSEYETLQMIRIARAVL